jgi:hypothetical protein
MLIEAIALFSFGLLCAASVLVANGGAIGKNKKRSFTIQQKRMALHYFNLTGNKVQTAKTFGCGRTNIQRWNKHQEEIFDSKTPSNAKRLNSSDKKKRGKYTRLEEKLHKWVVDECKQGHVITPAMCARQAEKFCQEFPDLINEKEGESQFKFSNGWFRRFMERFSIYPLIIIIIISL